MQRLREWRRPGQWTFTTDFREPRSKFLGLRRCLPGSFYFFCFNGLVLLLPDSDFFDDGTEDTLVALS